MGLSKEILVPSSGTYPAGQICFGEEVRSLRAMFQKPGKYVLFNALSSPVQLDMHRPFNRPFDLNFVGFSWYVLFAPFFAGISGSERLKVIPSSSCYAECFSLLQPYDQILALPANLVANTISSNSFSGAQRGFEWEFPNNLPYKFYPSFGVLETSRSLRDVRLRLDAMGAATTVQFALYYSFGPDVRVTHFRRAPIVYIGTTAVGETTGNFPIH